MEQTNKVAGDFKNTSGGLANQQRILDAELENAAAAIGQELLPIATEVITFLAEKALPAFGRLSSKLTGQVRPALEAVSNFIRDRVVPIIRDHVVPAVERMRDIFVRSTQRMKEVIEANGPALERIFKRIGDMMLRIAKDAGPLLETLFVTIFPAAIDLTIKRIDQLITDVDRANKRMKAWGLDKSLLDYLRQFRDWTQKIDTDIKNMTIHLKDFFKQLERFKGPSGDRHRQGHPQSHRRCRRCDLHAAGAARGQSVQQEPTGSSPASWTSWQERRRWAFVLPPATGLVPAHGVAPFSDDALGKAIDVVGSASQMARYFRWLIGQRDVKQAFYDPLGSIFGGALGLPRGRPL